MSSLLYIELMNITHFKRKTEEDLILFENIVQNQDFFKEDKTQLHINQVFQFWSNVGIHNAFRK